jgi:hypothetical protein
MKQNFKSSKYWRMKLKKQCKKKKDSEQKKFKRIGTKFDIKIIWNQMLIDEIENKIQLEKH